MQVTFVTTIVAGSPAVAALSLLVTLPSWGARAQFAIGVGSVIWFLTALSVYGYARRYRNDASD